MGEYQKDQFSDRYDDSLLDGEVYKQLLSTRRLFIERYRIDQERNYRKLRLQRFQTMVSGLTAFILFVSAYLYVLLEVDKLSTLENSVLFALIAAMGLFAFMFTALSLQVSRRHRDFREVDLLSELDKSWVMIDKLREANEQLRASASANPLPTIEEHGGDTNDHYWK